MKQKNQTKISATGEAMIKNKKNNYVLFCNLLMRAKRQGQPVNSLVSLLVDARTPQGGGPP